MVVDAGGQTHRGSGRRDDAAAATRGTTCAVTTRPTKPTTAMALSMPSGGPKGCRCYRSGLQNASDFAAAERKLRKRQRRELEKYNAKNGGEGRTVYRDKSGRRKEFNPAVDEAELARTEREREERQSGSVEQVSQPGRGGSRTSRRPSLRSLPQ